MNKRILQYLMLWCWEPSGRLSRFVSRRLGGARAARECEKTARVLEHHLRQKPPGLPPSLHATIMDAVRLQAHTSAASHRQFTPQPAHSRPRRWVLAATAAAAVLILGWQFYAFVSLPVKTAPLVMGQDQYASLARLPQTGPLVEALQGLAHDQLIQPWSDQCEALTQDAQATARFLLASLPL